MSPAPERPQHALEGDPSIFLRFRNGFRLYIKPDIRAVLAPAIKDLVSADHTTYLREHIKDISDGSGLGIHPDSTWLVALQELLRRYEDDTHTIEPATKAKLLVILELAASGPIEENWDAIRQKVLDDIDALSGWENRQRYMGQHLEGTQRNEDGTYTRTEDGQEVQIIGIKTFDEERYEYIANSSLREYGTLFYLFKLIALMDIADQYKQHPEHFSDRSFCLLHDNSGNQTGYLHWNWQIYGVYDFIPAFWRPRSCFSDPEWLAHDLMAVYSSQFERRDPTQPRIPFESTDDFTKHFSGYMWQYEISLTTFLILGDSLEYYFEFEDRHVRWINGDRFAQPMIVVPSNEEGGEDALKIALRFLSVMSKLTDQAITPQVESLNQLRHIPWLSQPRITALYQIDPTYLLPSEDVASYTPEKFVAIALRREGVNAASVFYKFLSFYKIVELACIFASKQAEDWINETVKDAPAGSILAEWRDNTLPATETAFNYLYGSNRCAIAHIKRSTTRGTGLTDPDDPTDFLRVKFDNAAVKALADKAIKELL